ncbi:hypothetical protein BC833DRAFT_526259 [Globomyces pollinis-pini]|nr:hypothetical protein BC833DRAFT_526259 [Globomyces pollinis-pini]
MKSTYLPLAIASGIFASLASVFSKLASNPITVERYLESLVTKEITRILMVACVVICNAIMWGTFTLALNKSPRSIQVTILNTCSNMITTGVSGWILFQEVITVKWVVGVSMIVVGSLVLSTRDEVSVDVKKQE